jgi:hypothetical protein
MEMVIGFFLLAALWLTFLTHKNRQQSAENKKLQNQNNHYIKVIEKFKLHTNGKDKTEEVEEEGSNAGDQS